MIYILITFLQDFLCLLEKLYFCDEGSYSS